MEKMKRISLISGLMAIIPQMAAAQSDPQGSLVYSLPSTSIRIEVEAQQENFYAGPYARYAMKYLGVDAGQQDRVTFTVKSVKMTPCIEADQSSRYALAPGTGMPAFLSLSSQGLVSLSSASSGETSWRFPSAAGADFSERGLSSNLTSESATLYRNVKNESKYDRIAVQQEMVVQKSLEAKAKEAAEMIFSLRSRKVQIVTGDTDATFSGEALAAAVDEITKLEGEYLSLFTGYSEMSVQKMNFDVVPSKDNASQLYVAFRLSDSKGLVPADDMSGKPYLIELVPEEVNAVGGKTAPVKGNVAHYRVPAVCKVKLSDGVDVLLQSRMPVYQLGIESTFPLSSK